VGEDKKFPDGPLADPHLNKVYLEGYLSSKPAVRRPPSMNTQKLQGLTQFNLAVRNQWKGEGKRKTHGRTHFFKIIVWGQKWIEYLEEAGLKKNSDVMLKGELRAQSWTTPKGKRLYSVEVHVPPWPKGHIEVYPDRNAKAPPTGGEGATEGGAEESEWEVPVFDLEDMP